MKFYEILEVTKDGDFDLCDNVYDIMYTFCWDRKMFETVEEYNLFCKELFKKIEVDNVIETNHVSLRFTDFIQKNKELLTEYMKNNWQRQYAEDDDFEYEWCKEFMLFFCGYATDSQYRSLREEVLEKAK